MNTETLIENLKKKFSAEILETQIKNQRRVTMMINPGSLLRVADYLFMEAGYRFIIATALQSRNGFEIYYHFSYDPTGLVLNIHVKLDKYNPEIESLSNMFSASNWIEREIHELFGINFLHHPNQEKLISEGNWAEGTYPFRKEFN